VKFRTNNYIGGLELDKLKVIAMNLTQIRISFIMGDKRESSDASLPMAKVRDLN
jgi:hypothetical protein